LYPSLMGFDTFDAWNRMEMETFPFSLAGQQRSPSLGDLARVDVRSSDPMIQLTGSS
jgi:hypothetical protein